MHQWRCSDCHWASLWKSEFHWASKQKEAWPRCRKWEHTQLNPWNPQNYSIKPSPVRGQSRAHTALWTGTVPLNILLFFLLLSCLGHRLWDPTRLSALIKKLHIPPGCRGKLRKVCSISIKNKGRQTKGGLCFGIGHLEFFQNMQDLLKNISKLNCENWSELWFNKNMTWF